MSSIRDRIAAIERELEELKRQKYEGNEVEFTLPKMTLRTLVTPNAPNETFVMFGDDDAEKKRVIRNTIYGSATYFIEPDDLFSYTNNSLLRFFYECNSLYVYPGKLRIKFNMDRPKKIAFFHKGTSKPLDNIYVNKIKYTFDALSTAFDFSFLTGCTSDDIYHASHWYTGEDFRSSCIMFKPDNIINYKFTEEGKELYLKTGSVIVHFQT